MGYVSRMEEDNIRKWEDLDSDLLARIFQKFDIFELTSVLRNVCRSWHFAACNSMLWRTIDFSMLVSKFIKTPLEPYVYVHAQFDKDFTELLKIVLNLSQGSTTTLIFNVNLYVSDDQLTYTAERTPNVKRLVLPTWNRIKKTGICRAISMWKDLESLTMPSIVNPPYFMEAISKHCKKFSELKIMGPCDIFFVQTLIRCVPNLKLLSLRCSIVYKDALLLILDDLTKLEVLNISHCHIVESSPEMVPRKVVNELDMFVLEKALRLREFWTCMDDSCIMCQRMKVDEGLIRWYRYEKGLWKEDEVKSLAV